MYIPYWLFAVTFPMAIDICSPCAQSCYACPMDKFGEVSVCARRTSFWRPEPLAFFAPCWMLVSAMAGSVA